MHHTVVLGLEAREALEDEGGELLGGTQTGSYQTGSYQKGRFIPPKQQLSYLLFLIRPRLYASDLFLFRAPRDMPLIIFVRAPFICPESISF